MIDQAEIHRMAHSDSVEEQRKAVKQLREKFSVVPDKKQAWDDLIHLTQEMDYLVYNVAVRSLGFVFPHISNKKQPWEDLRRLAQDKRSNIKRYAIESIAAAFFHIPNKEQAWEDLHRSIQDFDFEVKWEVADVLGDIFPHIPDKKQAWEDLHRLTQDEGDDHKIQWCAAHSLGFAFPYVPDKKLAWNDLIRLTQYEHTFAQISAYYSLGRASIFKATEAQSEEEFRKELENSLNYFGNPLMETTYFNPAEFCLPFYRSFYMITFKNQEAENEVKKYLAVAKNAVEGSESKEKLLEAVENLGNALEAVHMVREVGLETMKTDLDAYRRYLDRAEDLLETNGEKAPGATSLIKKGLPIIDERIKEIIGEIQEKTKALCKQTKGTQLEDLGINTYREGQKLSQVRDPIGLEKAVRNMQDQLSAICAELHEEDEGGACELLIKINNEIYVEDKIDLINIFLSKIPSNIQIVKEHEKIHKKLNGLNESVNRIERKTDRIIECIQKIETSCDQIIYDLENGGVKLKEEYKKELKTLADDLMRANKEQFTNFANEIIKLLKDPDLQRKIEREAPNGLKSKVKKTFYIITEMLNELSIALGAAVTAEELLPYIEAIMHEITILSRITPGVASTLVLIPLIALKMKTVK